ncbi:hypothetical protein [Spirosoma validum]|uniref:Uncharacterized protein n=1 Tax=Spirosoma validum TaxID=2771355 RepID=A0A927B5Z8_9BACT|nr:hypothetical protein [Spirosoma validum]MBD2756305.1 hypothetical protein [Spirosoma validum]
MSTYSITITLDNQTIDQLQSKGYTLYAFKAVQAYDQVQPLVWLSNNHYSPTTTISWQDRLTAFTSNSQLSNGAVVQTSATYNMDLGQMLQVNNNGYGTVTMGQPGQITIQNATFSPLTCGLGQPIQQSPNALICASQAYPNSSLSLAPVNKVLLLFSTTPSQPGTVTQRAAANGIFLDLNGITNSTVSYNLNQGWSNSSVPSQLVQAGQSLAQLLIQG